MGCRYESPLFNLADVSPLLPGLEVRMREASLAEYARIAPLLDQAVPVFAVEQGDRPPAGALAAMGQLQDEIGPLIVDWNLETLEGEPVPVSEWPVQGMAFQLAVAVAWCTGMVAYADSVAGREDESGDDEAAEVEESLASLEKPPG